MSGQWLGGSDYRDAGGARPLPAAKQPLITKSDFPPTRLATLTPYSRLYDWPSLRP